MVILFILILTPISPVTAFHEKSTVFVDANNEYFSLAEVDKDGIDVTTDFTIEFWLKFDTLPAASEYVYYNYTGTEGVYLDLHNPSGNFLLEWQGNGRCYGRSDIVRDTSWHHYAFAVDADNDIFSAYIDGIATSVSMVDTSCNSIADPNSTMEINSNEKIDGHLDEFRFWGDLRTANEILSHYNCEIQNTSTTSLVAYWQFEDDGDDSAGTNDLTENNTPVYAADSPVSGHCYSSPAATSTTATSTPLQAPCSLLGINDIGVISWCELETNEAGTATTTRQGVAHIPFLVYIVFALPLLWIGGRMLIEIIIRYRR